MCTERVAFTLALPTAVLLTITSFFQIGGGEAARLLGGDTCGNRPTDGESSEADGCNVGGR